MEKTEIKKKRNRDKRHLNRPEIAIAAFIEITNQETGDFKTLLAIRVEKSVILQKLVSQIRKLKKLRKCTIYKFLKIKKQKFTPFIMLRK